MTASIISCCDFENSQISRHTLGVAGDDIMFHILVFCCHRLSLFLWHNIFVHLFEDLWIITHCELSYQDFVRMSSLIVHCERNSPITTGFPTLKASNTDHWLFIPQPSGLEGYCRHGPGGRLPDLWNPYLCNRLTDVLFLKFCGIVEACSCALSWSFAHSPHMGLLMGQKLVKFATN